MEPRFLGYRSSQLGLVIEHLVRERPPAPARRHRRSSQPVRGDHMPRRIQGVRGLPRRRSADATGDVTWGVATRTGRRIRCRLGVGLGFRCSQSVESDPRDSRIAVGTLPAHSVRARGQGAGCRRIRWGTHGGVGGRPSGSSGMGMAESRAVPTLLLPVDPAIGLTRRHVDDLITWAGSLPTD
jgi:hypothetical protein